MQVPTTLRFVVQEVSPGMSFNQCYLNRLVSNCAGTGGQSRGSGEWFAFSFVLNNTKCWLFPRASTLFFCSSKIKPIKDYVQFKSTYRVASIKCQPQVIACSVLLNEHRVRFIEARGGTPRKIG